MARKFRSALPVVPEGTLVFRSHLDLVEKKMRAPCRKGFTGWALLDDGLVECIPVKGSWRVKRMGVLAFVRVRRSVTRAPVGF